MKIFTKRQMQDLENCGVQNGVTLAHMMEQAGRALASVVEGRSVALLCGAGNNGGDGFVCARILADQGARCTVLLVQGEPKAELARAVFLKMPPAVTTLCTERQPEDCEAALRCANCIVDCIFGFGFNGTLAGDPARYLALANTLAAFRVAADLPSGAECDTAQVSENTFQADVTVAFTAQKPAHVSYPAKSFCGKTVVAQVGVPAHLAEDFPTTHFVPGPDCLHLPSPNSQANKGDLGRLLLVCGSYGMAGACIMAAKGALRSGVGLLHIAVDARVYPIVAGAVPEAVFTVLDFDGDWQRDLLRALEACTACVIGSGLGALSDRLCPVVFDYFSHQGKPLLADADALNYCARTPGALKALTCPLVITPHPGEMARLLGTTASQVQARRMAVAQEFAAETGTVTVLKGAGTVVTDGTRTGVNPTGGWGMAKGGSGDVLAGITGALLAQALAPFDAAVTGAYIHGLAGDLCAGRLGPRSMLPTDLPESLPEAFLSLQK